MSRTVKRSFWLRSGFSFCRAHELDPSVTGRVNGARRLRATRVAARIEARPQKGRASGRLYVCYFGPTAVRQRHGYRRSQSVDGGG